ncbi:MAG: DNA/RNA nuclease SfsA [Eubacteriaceae bacterium]|nr:DNA/RNA nuclease SfsA [Eubacteriaceae bacterium]
MKYENITQAKFIDRPNRFIANIEIRGKPEICHVKNTGRCKELLISGAKIYVQESGSKTRKTKYDLISVEKNGKLVNIDSQAPNKVFAEWIRQGNLFCKEAVIKTEAKHASSRFDFYIEDKGNKSFIETKGATLEKDGIAMFPDAPTLRGVKHIQDLVGAVNEGYLAYMVFIIQMEPVFRFTPNKETHPEFADALRAAKNAGVEILAFDCIVSADAIKAKGPIEVVL